MEIPSLRQPRPATLARVLTGVFLAQVLAKAAVTYLPPYDPQRHDTVASATYNALYSTVHQDASLLPPVLALLRNNQ